MASQNRIVSYRRAVKMAGTSPKVGMAADLATYQTEKKESAFRVSWQPNEKFRPRRCRTFHRRPVDHLQTPFTAKLRADQQGPSARPWPTFGRFSITPCLLASSDRHPISHHPDDSEANWCCPFLQRHQHNEQGGGGGAKMAARIGQHKGQEVA